MHNFIHQFPSFRRDRNKHGGGKMVFVRNNIIAKRLESLEEKESETICIEITISNKRWCITFVYRPPQNANKVMSFNESNLSLNQCVNKYDNIIVMGDQTLTYRIKEKTIIIFCQIFVTLFLCKI